MTVSGGESPKGSEAGHVPGDGARPPQQRKRSFFARRKRWIVTVVLLAGLALYGWFAVPVIEETVVALEGPPEPPRFFYRVKADVIFDGSPYTIDEWIACNTKTFYSPSSGEHWGYYRSVQAVGVRTADGGALFVRTPDLCRPIWARHKALEAGEPDTPPLSEVGAPANHLPEFFWFDDADSPTQVEAYLSEIYYMRPDRRLTIEDVAFGSAALEPPAGVEVVDFGTKIPDPFDPCELIRPYAINYPLEVRAKHLCFGGYGAFPYVEEEWQLSPGLVAFVEEAPDDRLTPVTLEFWREHGVKSETIIEHLDRPSLYDIDGQLGTAYRSGFGIPRLEETEAGNCASMLAPVSGDTCRNLRRFDMVLPILCEDTRCTLIEGEPGVYFFRYYPRPFPPKVLDVRGQDIPLPYGEAAGWYDPSTRTFWWVIVTIDL